MQIHLARGRKVNNYELCKHPVPYKLQIVHFAIQNRAVMLAFSAGGVDGERQTGWSKQELRMPVQERSVRTCSEQDSSQHAVVATSWHPTKRCAIYIIIYIRYIGFESAFSAMKTFAILC